MKPMKAIILLLSLFSVQFLPAQSIDSIAFSPSHPTYNDTVYARLYCTKAMTMDYLSRISVSVTEDSILIKAYGISCGGWSVMTSFDTVIPLGHVLPGNYIISGITCADTNTTDSSCQIEPQLFCYDTVTSHLIILSTPEIPGAQIQLFPNPFGSKLRLELGKSYRDVKLTIFNQYGQVVRMESAYNVSELELDRYGLANGCYFLRIVLDNDLSVTRKIVVAAHAEQ